MSDIQDYFEYILQKKHEETTDIISIMIHVNKITNRITFKVRREYYFELLTPETMEVLGSTKIKITKDENGEDVSNLEVTEAMLLQCNIANNNCQQNSRVLQIFVPNKYFG